MKTMANNFEILQVSLYDKTCTGTNSAKILSSICSAKMFNLLLYQENFLSPLPLKLRRHDCSHQYLMRALGFPIKGQTKIYLYNRIIIEFKGHVNIEYKLVSNEKSFDVNNAAYFDFLFSDKIQTIQVFFVRNLDNHIKSVNFIRANIFSSFLKYIFDKKR